MNSASTSRQAPQGETVPAGPAIATAKSSAGERVVPIASVLMRHLRVLRETGGRGQIASFSKTVVGVTPLPRVRILPFVDTGESPGSPGLSAIWLAMTGEARNSQGVRKRPRKHPAVLTGIAKTTCSRAFVRRVHVALGADGALLELLPAVIMERIFEREDRAEERSNARSQDATVADDVRRRSFLGLGLVALVLGPGEAARALSELEGDQIASDWTREVVIAANRQALMPGLTADLKRLAETGGPQRTIASLSTCAAMIQLSSGNPEVARRRWSRAHVAARASGDRKLAAYVAGQHAYDGVHVLYRPSQALALADQAVSITNAPCAGRMHALGARARALALLGRKREAQTAVRDLEAAYSRLPHNVTNRPIGGWSEDRLHHVASFVVAFGGVGSATAHDDGAQFGGVLWRNASQIELHRAAAEVDAEHAIKTLTELTRAQQNDQFIRRLAGRTMLVIEGRGADVSDLREVLA
jgi:hypothetical protein